VVDISEADWKLFKSVRDLALERLCHRILSEVIAAATDTTKGSHQRYLDVWKEIESGDKEVVHVFDGFSRSKAPLQLLSMRSMGLVTDEEFSQFSEPIRNTIDGILNRN